MSSQPKPPPPSADDSPAVNPELLALQEEYAVLKLEADKMKDMAARAQADLLNAKDRLERERQDVARFAMEGFLKMLLPTVDNFQRAFQHLPKELKNQEWVKGITAMEQNFMKTVTVMGLQKMECLGQSVDPEKHEVLMSGPGEVGKVVQVLEEGYTFNGKVLRVAKVMAGAGEHPTTPSGLRGAGER
ncbi:MAG: nucleotide exchange factor GrpE [Candidatus Peregrinibacteria bacterium]